MGVLGINAPNFNGRRWDDFEVPLVSIGSSSNLHTSVINLGNDKEIWFFLALIPFSDDVSNTRSLVLLCMIQPRQDSLGRRTIISFWDGIFGLLIKQNKNLAGTFRCLFSIGSPSFIHLSVFLKSEKLTTPSDRLRMRPGEIHHKGVHNVFLIPS